MSSKDLGYFTQRLKDEKARILNTSFKNQQSALKFKVEDLADEVDLASSTLNQSVALRLQDRDRSMLHKIEVALSKIENGTFGICDSCGDSIETKRLEVRPVANLCIQCKEAQEKREKEKHMA